MYIYIYVYIYMYIYIYTYMYPPFGYLSTPKQAPRELGKAVISHT